MTETEPPRLLGTDALRFLVFGALNTGATLVLYQIFLFFLPPRAAYTTMFACGILISAGLYSRFVFANTLQWRLLTAYTLFHLSSYLVGLCILALCVELVDIDSRIAILVVIAIMTPLNFLGARLTLRRSPGINEH